MTYRHFLAFLVFAGCVSAPTTPPGDHVLEPVPVRLEGLENGWIRQRGGDFLLDMQCERIAQAVAIRMILVNLSGESIAVNWELVTLQDAQGVLSRPLTPDEVVAMPAPDAGIKQDENTYSEGSVEKNHARITRAEGDRLRRTLDKKLWPKGSLTTGHRAIGTLYMTCPQKWPAHITVHVGDQTFEALFTQTEYRSL
jgi:hypothetical protein